MKRTLYAVSIILLLLAGCGTAEEAELVIWNGRVLTVDEHFSVEEAVAVLDGKILFTGSNKSAERFIGPGTELIDAGGLTVLPGLIDSHAHLVSLGDELYNLNISDCKSFDEIVEKVAARVAEAEPGEWISGGRWDHTEWPSGEYPVHDRLSAVSPDNPVYLKRVDGNSAFVNMKAMELAGISADTEDPPGGKIVRKDNGDPTGILINQAMNRVKELAWDDSEELSVEKLALAMDQCVKSGLTCVHEAGVGPREIGIMKRMAGSGHLTLRINAMLGEQEKPVFEADNLEEYFRSNKMDSYANDYLCVNRIKLFFDGALGSRGAAFFEDYDDDPGNRGLLRISPEYISEVTRAALACGMSVATHCIGIRGNSLCLDAYEEALSEYDNPDHRLRIEHAQVVREEDIGRFARSGIIPAMQAIHCTSDKDMIADRIGEERAQFAYAWRSFIDLGLPVPGGSDFPVEPENPFMGIYAAATRRLPEEDAAAGWHVEQRMTREEAIKSYTIWAAYAGFQEGIMGSIEPGKWADFTIIDRDILTCDPELIPETKVIYTIVGGEVKYTAAGQ